MDTDAQKAGEWSWKFQPCSIALYFATLINVPSVVPLLSHVHTDEPQESRGTLTTPDISLRLYGEPTPVPLEAAREMEDLVNEFNLGYLNAN